MNALRCPLAVNCARGLRLPQRLIILSITVGLCASPLLIASAKTKRHRKLTSRLNAVAHQKKRSITGQRREENEAVLEDVDARDNWFWRQRIYPFNALPDRARERAWAARPVNKGIKPETLTWVSIGPVSTASSHVSKWGTTSGRVSAIAVSPADANLVLIGSPTGGLWRSTDAGAHFVPVGDNLTEISIGSIAFAPSDPSIVYAGAGDDYNQPYFGQGVLKSTDGGVTWTKTSDASLPAPSVTRQVAVDPTNAAVVYAIEAFVKNTTTDGQIAGGFWRSIDGGVTWKKTASGLFRSMAIRPGAPQTLYLGANRNDSDGGTGGVYISTDGGLTWNISERSAFTTTADMRVAVTSADPNKIYVYEGGNNGGPRQLEVEVSSDGGFTWSDRGTRTDIDPIQFGYDTFIAVSPADANVVIIGARDLFRSTDGGLNFTNIVGNYAAPSFVNYTPGKATTHSDQQSFAFSPADANTIYFGNDGGLFKTTDGGTTLTSLNDTLSLTQFAGYSIDPTDASRSYGGSQDNGSQRSQSGTNRWKEVSEGDGGNTVVDQLDPSTIYVTYVNGSIYRYINYGADYDATVGADDNSTFGEPKNNPRIAFFPPFTGNGVDSKLYFGTWKLFTSNNRGDTWTATSADDLTTGDSSDVLNAIGVSQSNTNVIYTGSYFGRVNLSKNGGTTWTNITSGLPNRTITSISVNRTTPATAFLTVSGFGSGHVFKTTNSGTTWTDISNNLPNIPANCLLIDPQTASTLYIGTDIGVFRSTDGGTTWIAFNDGMPPVVVNKLVNSGTAIQAATYGRGAYQLVDLVTVSPPLVQFSAANFPVSEGAGATNFTITRSGDPSGTSTVNYATSNGSATEGKDYVAAIGSVTFAAGETSKSVPVLIIDNAFVDGTRTVNLTLSGATGSRIAPQSTATVTITDNDAVLGTNPLDTPRSFVQLQYYDFLSRVPDQSGWDFWTNQVTQCGANPSCIESARVNVSAAFFLSIEYQQTGYFVERMYKVAYGDATGNSNLGGAHTLSAPIIKFTEFLQDSHRVGQGVVVLQSGWEQVLENNKQAYASEFVQTTRFMTAFPTSMTPAQFVDKLNQNAGNLLTAADRTSAINLFAGAADTTNITARAQAVRQLVDNAVLNANEFNRAFVLTEYFGYLRRNPNDAPDTDYTGYEFWLNKLNQFNGNYINAEMVKAFLSSTEYRGRFGTP